MPMGGMLAAHLRSYGLTSGASINTQAVGRDDRSVRLLQKLAETITGSIQEIYFICFCLAAAALVITFFLEDNILRSDRPDTIVH